MELPPQVVTVVSCNVTEKADVGSTELDVSVRIGDGEPFRLRSHNGRPIKLRHFSRASEKPKAVEWAKDLFTVGNEIEVIFEVIPARWQTAADGFVKGDRAIDPTRIRATNPKVARALAPPPPAHPANQEPIMMNGGDRMIAAR